MLSDSTPKSGDDATIAERTKGARTAEDLRRRRLKLVWAYASNLRTPFFFGGGRVRKMEDRGRHTHTREPCDQQEPRVPQGCSGVPFAPLRVPPLFDERLDRDRRCSDHARADHTAGSQRSSCWCLPVAHYFVADCWIADHLTGLANSEQRAMCVNCQALIHHDRAIEVRSALLRRPA